MTSTPLPAVPEPVALPILADYYAAQSQAIQQNFETSYAGVNVLRARCDLVDALAIRLYQQFISRDPNEPKGLSLVALGGYGRRELFPHSDIDVLFLTADDGVQAQHRDALAAMVRMLWDLRMRMGNTTHTLAECGRLYNDNLEFNVALLDIRYLAGDPELYTRLRTAVVPHLVARDRSALVRNLVDLTGQRHGKHGNTIFHLEPNLKEAPGCLRDLHVCRWLARIEELEKNANWTPPEELWPERDRPAARQAFAFLADARCFLHYHYGRDDNQLRYDAQAQAAARGVGVPSAKGLEPADWMRIYFRQARAIDQLTAQLIGDSAPARSGLYSLYQDWRSRLSNADFSVVRGRIYARNPGGFSSDPLLLLRLFEMVARHGLPLSREAEKAVESALDHTPMQPLRPPQLWQHFARLLVQPYAADALRAMHRVGLLIRLFPEFQAIDSLVVRDFYHRYTVDEHSLMTIENLHRLLRQKDSEPASSLPGRAALKTWQKKFAEILSELEQPELLYLTMLFHDVGKGFPQTESHVKASLDAVQSVQETLQLPDNDWETVEFLIAKHLEMSAASQRRDVFDPETVRGFAKIVGTQERLKMLCLLTYTDICSVNPEAMTPWKAELLWQLYAATTNYLARSVDDERLRITGTAELEAILAALPVPAGIDALSSFLEGFPRRYTATHTPQRIAGHFELARRLGKDPIAVEIQPGNGYFELTVVTADRPFLFASITGTLAAWGMSIVKADAFANGARTILDTFTFADLHRTFELNPSEKDRFRLNLLDVLRGSLELKNLLQGRAQAGAATPPKIEVSTRVRFDDQSSSHSTLLELVAHDRAGLLYDVSSVLADQGCNIEVALIDTEGQRAIDVFYLTYRGGKLDAATEAAVGAALRQRLG